MDSYQAINFGAIPNRMAKLLQLSLDQDYDKDNSDAVQYGA